MSAPSSRTIFIDARLRMNVRKAFLKPASIVVLVLLLVAPGTGRIARAASSSIVATVTSPLKFTATQGDKAVHSEALKLRNTGTTTVEWKASSSQSWLRFEPASGSLSPNATASIDLVADPAGFAPGIYVASVQVAIPNEPLQIFDATLVEPPAFAGDSLTNAERTFPPDSGMVNVKNHYRRY
jgi:hypothetical protein